MDIERKDLAQKKKRKQIVVSVVTTLVLVAAVVGVSRMEPASPTIDRGSVWLDTVKRGPLLREVRGIGTLVPEDNRLITAVTIATVEQLVIYPGAAVEPDTVILAMSNPQLQQEAENVRLQLKAAEAELRSLKVQHEGRLLEMESALAELESLFKRAQLEAEVNAELFKEGLTAELIFKQSQLNAEQLEKRFELEKRRLDFEGKAQQSQIDTQRAVIDQLGAEYNLRADQIDNLQVRAGVNGVLQRLPVETGQQVVPGTVLAEVADPTVLKAIVQIPETQAKDIVIGQTASIDTRNGIIEGKVMRVDPTVESGTVAVDVRLLTELPRGARPDLTIEGTIELERLADVVYVGRPAFGRADSKMGIFKIEEDGVHAVRTTAHFGRSSVSAIEIIEGLVPGDKVILSDTSQWDEHKRIKIIE